MLPPAGANVGRSQPTPGPEQSSKGWQSSRFVNGSALRLRDLSGYTVRELRDRSGRLSEDLRLVPFDAPELRHGATGDWWALGELEGSVRNPDGSRRTFTVEVGLSLIPRGDILHREEEFWRMVAEKLPLIAQKLAPG